MATAEQNAQIERLLREADVDGATAAIGAVLKTNAGDPDGHTFRGRLMAAQGDLDGAIAALDLALKTDANHGDALTFKAAIAFEKGDRQSARKLLEQAIKVQPDSPHTAHNYGRVLMGEGKVAEGVDMLKAAVEHDPDNAMYNFVLSRALTDIGDLEGTFHHLGKTLNLNPYIVDAWLVLTRLQLQNKDVPNARANLEEALKHNPGHPALREAQVNAALLAGDIPGAVKTAEALVAEFPDNAPAQSNLATCYMAAERYADAEKTLRTALKLDPRDAATMHALGMLLDATESDAGYAEAKTLFEKAIKTDEGFWKPYNDLGLLHMNVAAYKDEKRALSLLEKAVTLTQRRAPEALFNLAVAQAKTGSGASAKTLCDEVAGHPLAAAALKEQAGQLKAAIG